MRKVSRSGSTSDPSVPAPNEKVQQLTPQQKIGSEKNTHTHKSCHARSAHAMREKEPPP